MARASAVLAAGSRIPGVLLHGMPGGGKTACALELAYTHEHAFDRLVWFKAPDEGQDIRGALADFALTLENELPNFQMAHLLVDEDKLAGFLPRLTELAEQKRVLIVIDNIESRLTEGGQWLDDPLLLARELPNLNKLIRGELPGVDADVSRRLALGVLNVAQGHPKLLKLADGLAATPERLNELVAEGDSAWRDQGVCPTASSARARPARRRRITCTCSLPGPGRSLRA